MSQKNKEFAKLKSKWYGKLKKSGFQDIEKNEYDLVDKSYIFSRDYDPDKFRAKEEYYRMAEEFLTNYHFQDNTDRFIWSQHAEGTSIRDIVKLLKVKRIKSYKFKVHAAINRLQRLMFLGLGSSDD